MGERLGTHPPAANKSQYDFVNSLRSPYRPGQMSWTRELERLSWQAGVDRRELARREATIELLVSELSVAEGEVEDAVDEIALSAHARELLADEVRALREQLADSGAPRYAEATYLAHRAKAAVAERDERIAALEAALTEREAELENARELLRVGGQLTQQVRRAGLELDERTRELAEARAEGFRLQNDLVNSERKVVQLEEALREAHARLQAGVSRSRQQALRVVADQLRAQLAVEEGEAQPQSVRESVASAGGDGAAASYSRRTTLYPHGSVRLTSL